MPSTPDPSAPLVALAAQLMGGQTLADRVRESRKRRFKRKSKTNDNDQKEAQATLEAEAPPPDDTGEAAGDSGDPDQGTERDA